MRGDYVHVLLAGHAPLPFRQATVYQSTAPTGISYVHVLCHGTLAGLFHTSAVVGLITHREGEPCTLSHGLQQEPEWRNPQAYP